MGAASRHRGKHPGDDELFGAAALGRLRVACEELSWLLSRGYTDGSALKLVGDRHNLTRRQRQAVSRCSAGDGALAGRTGRRVAPGALRGEPVALDGFNCVIVLETALSGGVVLVGRDGCLRDLSSIHGTYRAVSETPRALELIGEALQELSAGPICWYLDRPVSNSGRLRATMAEIAERRGWCWQIELRYNPDRALVEDEGAVAVTSDAWVLDNCRRWTNLLRWVLDRQRNAGKADHVWLVDLAIT